MRDQQEEKTGQIDDRAIRQWLKWAIWGAGRTARDVSRRLGYQPDYLSDKLSFHDRMGKEFIAKVLGELGFSMGDFFTCVEGRLGDPRIHLGRILATAEAPAVWPSKFPSAKQRKSPKRPPVDIWQLEAERFEVSLKRTAQFAGWYACFGATEAEKCEGWGVLGIAQRQQRRLRHSAYCFLKAFEFCEVGSQQQALVLRRMAYLMTEVNRIRLSEACLHRALKIFVTTGDMEYVGRVFVDQSLGFMSRGAHRPSIELALRAIDLTSDPWHQFAAHQFAGLCQLKLGQIEEALRMADYCRAACRTSREAFYGQYLYARCLVYLERWPEAIKSLQKATNIPSYDGIYLGDQLEVEILNIRCHLELADCVGAQIGIDRFRRIALLVSKDFADAYSKQLAAIISGRNVKAVLKLQASFQMQFQKYRQSV